MRKIMIFFFIAFASGIGGSGPAWCKNKKAHPKPLPLPTINGASHVNSHEDEIEVITIDRKTPASNGNRVNGPTHHGSALGPAMKR